MDASRAIVAAGLVVLVMLYLLRTRHPPGRLTPLAGVAFACVLAAVAFGESRPWRYSLLGAGVGLALVDLWRKRVA